MAKEPNIVRAKVTQATYINGVLHQPGEVAHVNLDALGIGKLGETRDVTDVNGNKSTVNLTPGLEEVGDDAPDAIAEVRVAAVAPHAPEAPNAQGIPPGTVQSGTGRLMGPTGPDETAHELVGADKPTREEAAEKASKPTK